MTPRRNVFVAEFMIDFNGTAAARRAGYSAHSAARYARQLLGMPEVARAIEERMAAEEGAVRAHIRPRAGRACRDRVQRHPPLRHGR